MKRVKDSLDGRNHKEKIKELVEELYDILTDVSQNPFAQELIKQQEKLKRKVEKVNRSTEKGKEGVNRNLMDRHLRKAQGKFPDVEIIAKDSPERIIEYIQNIVEEVRIEYKQDDQELNQSEVKFIEKRLGARFRALHIKTEKT